MRSWTTWWKGAIRRSSWPSHGGFPGRRGGAPASDVWRPRGGSGCRSTPPTSQFSPWLTKTGPGSAGRPSSTRSSWGGELDARIVVAHLGARRGEEPGVLLDRIREHLDWIGAKVSGLGVGLGLETTGRLSHMGSLGDIALLAAEFPFVRPVVDWAHVHAISRGGLVSAEAFATVLGFLRENFPGWKIDPLHTQFSDVLYGEMGEIRHIPYGDGTLRVEPLMEAVRAAGMRIDR